MSKLPTAEFNEGWEEGRHSADVEVMQLRAEIERLRIVERDYQAQLHRANTLDDENARLRAELALYKQNYARKQLTDSERRALEDRK